MKPYTAHARAAALSALAYRGNFLLSLGGAAVQLIAMLAVWKVLLADGRVGGFDWPQMRAYLVVAFASATLVGTFVDFRMSHRIRSGLVALDLVKPVDYQRARFAETAGGVWIEAVAVVVVVAITVAVGGALDTPPGPMLGLFAASIVLIVPLKFAVSYLSTLACFWTENFVGVLWARQALTGLLSGALVPLAFFPGWLATTAQWSPFAGLTSTPALIFIGQASGTHAVLLVATQLGWVLVMWYGARLLFRRGLRRLTVNGDEMRTIRLYVRLLGAHLRSLLEYESDFWIMMVGTAIMQVVNVVFLAAIFAKVPHINGWSFWAVVAMFAMVAIAEGVGSLFFEGMWNLAWQINQGDLDYMMVRPYPIVLQVSSMQIGVNGISNIVTGGLMLGFAIAHLGIDWTVGRIAGGVIVLLSAIAVKVAINLATNSVSFWMQSPSPLFAFAVHQVGDLARFPLSIYPLALKAALGFALPFAFVSFFPVTFVLDTGDAWVGLLTPLVAAYCLAVAWFVFSRGLRRYESAGN